MPRKKRRTLERMLNNVISLGESTETLALSVIKEALLEDDRYTLPYDAREIIEFQFGVTSTTNETGDILFNGLCLSVTGESLIRLAARNRIPDPDLDAMIKAMLPAKRSI